MANSTFLCFGLPTTIFEILLTLYVFVSISTISLIKNLDGALRHVIWSFYDEHSLQLKIINIICLNHALITNGVTKRQYNRQYNIEYNQRHRILEYRILPKAIYYRNVDKRNILGWKNKGILEAVKMTALPEQ